MIYDHDKSEVVLSTGTRFYAYGNILGLDPDLHLSYGYDGNVVVDSVEHGPNFTASEREEIAAEMVERWRRWATSGVT